MSPGPTCTPTRWAFTPADLLAAWPRSQPLAALCSASDTSGPWSRWTVLTAPTRVHTIGEDDPSPLTSLAAAVEATRSDPSEPSPVPFGGGWLVALSYELGRTVEPKAILHAHRTDADWPWSAVLWRCPWAFAYDHAEARWWIVKSDSDAVVPDPADWIDSDGRHAEASFSLDQHSPSRPRTEYIAAVRRAVEYIHAGDCFQVNLAHRIEASFSGSTRSLFRAMLDAAAPWYGAYLELPRGRDLHAALSVSPELFLRYDASTRDLITRPIKGTRTAEAGADALRHSAKDRAELNMIIDLMRNDLGRVCEIGSVRVAEARAIETHASVPPGSKSREGQSGPAPALHHGVATIRGRLSPDRSIADLLRATFPGGSITGAPKVRAMQIIEELEPAPRGLYTGAVGFISDAGDLALNIAIRTAIVRGAAAPNSPHLDDVSHGTLAYGVGAGIVADSIPELEWQETLDKAGVLRNLPHTSDHDHLNDAHVLLGPGGAEVPCHGRKPTESVP